MTSLRLLGPIVLVALVVAGCERVASPTPSPVPVRPPASTGPLPSEPEIDGEALLYAGTYEPGEGRAGNSITIGHPAETTQLNPYFATEITDFAVMVATMPTLLTISSEGRWMPRLSDGPITYAGNVQEDDGGAGFTVTVRILPDLKWSDGTPFTLRDLAYTWAAVLEAAKETDAICQCDWDKVDRVDVAPDGLIADVHFAEPFSAWLTLLSSPILPEHYLEELPYTDWQELSYPITADLAMAPTLGPFKYAGATDQEIVLVRDENWAGPAVACGGRACLDRVVHRRLPEERETWIRAFVDGDVDVVYFLTQGVDDAVHRIDPAVGTVVVEPPAWEYEHLDFNLAGLGQGRGHPVLRDLVVRRAIAQAIDRRALWERVFPGTPVPDNNPCVDAAPTNYWRLPDAACPAFNVDEANAALDDAGYAVGDDGIRVDPASGTPLVFEHCSFNNSVRHVGSEFIAESLSRLGIRLNLTFVPMAVLFAPWRNVREDTKCVLSRGNYDTSQFLYFIGPDPWGNHVYLHSREIPNDANPFGNNGVRFVNDDMDAAIDALERTIDPGGQVRAAHDVQRISIEQIPEIVLYYPNRLAVVDPDLRNFFRNPSPNTDVWNLEDWWLDR